jgi:hypothetical protein
MEIFCPINLENALPAVDLPLHPGLGPRTQRTQRTRGVLSDATSDLFIKGWYRDEFVEN